MDSFAALDCIVIRLFWLLVERFLLSGYPSQIKSPCPPLVLSRSRSAPETFSINSMGKEMGTYKEEVPWLPPTSTPINGHAADRLSSQILQITAVGGQRQSSYAVTNMFEGFMDTQDSSPPHDLCRAEGGRTTESLSNDVFKHQRACMTTNHVAHYLRTRLLVTRRSHRRPTDPVNPAVACPSVSVFDESVP